MNVEFINAAPLTRQMEIVPTSLNEERGTVEVVASTGATVRRRDPWFGGEWDERLVISEERVKLDRLNAGAPVLDTHSWFEGTRGIRGITEPGSARVVDGKVVETLRIDRGNAEGAELWRQIRDGFVRFVSIGYDAEFDRIRAKDRNDGGTVDLLESRVLDIFETSFVPAGADPDAGVRNAPKGATRRYAVRSREETSMPAVDDNVIEIEKAKVRKQATLDATKRVLDIQAAGRRMQIEDADVQKLIDDPEIDIDKAKARMHDIRAAASDGLAISSLQTQFSRSADEKQAEAMRLALLERAMGRADKDKVEAYNRRALAEGRKDEVFTPTTDGTVRQLARMKCIQLAEMFLQSRGISTANLPTSEIAMRALSYRSAGGGLMGTADFPYLFENLANKMLLVGYGEAQSPWRVLSQEIPQPDFKQFKMYRRSQAPNLAKLNEHGEVKRAGYAEFTPLTGQLETAGVQVGMTRQMLVNDDMNAFSDQSLGLGDSVRRYEDDEATTLLLSTDNLNDGLPPFHSTRGNLSTDVGTPDQNAVVEVARLFATMTDTVKSPTANSGSATIKTPLQLTGFYCAWPEKLILEQICNLPFVPATSGTTRPSDISGKVIYDDARLLIESSPNIWFGISQRKALAHGGLEGDPSPRLRSMAATGTDGVVLELIHDFYVAWKDPKALVKVPRT